MGTKYLLLDSEEPEEPEIRIVLIGKTGAVRSAAGNILVREAFKSTSSPSTVTTESQRETGESEGQTLAVVDPPGLFDTSRTEEEVKTEVIECILLSAPGPHVILVVFQLGRFTKQEQEISENIWMMFGEKSGCYTVVLFTHEDDLKTGGVSLDQLIGPALSHFISQCSGGLHVFNNRDQDPAQVRDLLEKINMMVQRNGGRYFTNEMFQEAERVIRQEMKCLQRENPTVEPSEARIQVKTVRSFMWKVLLNVGALGGAALGAAAGAAVGAEVGAALGSVVGLLGGPAVVAAGDAVGAAVTRIVCGTGAKEKDFGI